MFCGSILTSLRERVLQPAADGDRAAGGGVEVGELLAADGAGGIDAGAGLVDDDVGELRQQGVGRVGLRGGRRLLRAGRPGGLRLARALEGARPWGVRSGRPWGAAVGPATGRARSPSPSPSASDVAAGRERPGIRGSGPRPGRSPRRTGARGARRGRGWRPGRRGRGRGPPATRGSAPRPSRPPRRAAGRLGRARPGARGARRGRAPALFGGRGGDGVDRGLGGGLALVGGAAGDRLRGRLVALRGPGCGSRASFSRTSACCAEPALVPLVVGGGRGGPLGRPPRPSCSPSSGAPPEIGGRASTGSSAALPFSDLGRGRFRRRAGLDGRLGGRGFRVSPLGTAWVAPVACPPCPDLARRDRRGASSWSPEGAGFGVGVGGGEGLGRGLGGGGLAPLVEAGALGDDLGDQLLGLAAGGAVADGDDADLVLADEVLRSCFASCRRFWGGCGWMTPCSTRLPTPSRTATLHPVRKPGSIARTTCLVIGGWSRRLRRLRAKTSTAWRSAISVRSRRTSRSRLGISRRSRASMAEWAKNSACGWPSSGSCEGRHAPGRAARRPA